MHGKRTHSGFFGVAFCTCGLNLHMCTNSVPVDFFLICLPAFLLPEDAVADDLEGAFSKSNSNSSTGLLCMVNKQCQSRSVAYSVSMRATFCACVCVCVEFKHGLALHGHGTVSVKISSVQSARTGRATRANN
jgi:hypothetical protein